MSAESASSSSAVGSSRSFASSVAGASAASARGSVPSSLTASTPLTTASAGAVGRSRSAWSSVSAAGTATALGTRGTTAGWPDAGEPDPVERPRSEAQQFSRDPVPPRQLQLIGAPHSTRTPAPRRRSVVTARPPAPGVNSHTIHVLAGHVQVTTREGSHELKAGALLVLSAGVTHDLYAPIQSQVLLPVSPGAQGPESPSTRVSFSRRVRSRRVRERGHLALDGCQWPGESPRWWP